MKARIDRHDETGTTARQEFAPTASTTRYHTPSTINGRNPRTKRPGLLLRA